MKRPSTRFISTMFLLSLSIAALATGTINNYQFRLIAQSATTSPISESFAMNNAGSVVYSVLPATNQYAQSREVFTSNGNTTQKIATFNCEPFCATTQVSINNAGTVGVLNVENRLTMAGYELNLIRNNGQTATIAEFIDRYRSLANPTINSRGEVVYLGPKPGTQSDRAIYVYRNGESTLIPTGTILGAPSINDNGTVVYTGLTAQGTTAIFTTNGNGSTAVVDNSGQFNEITRFPIINNQGTIAFASTLDNGGSGIFTVNNGEVKAIAVSNGTFSEIQQDFFSLNNRGEVVFGAVFRGSGTFGIFTSADPVKGKIIAIGDALFGATVTDVQLCHQCLNDRGDIAFYAELSDNRVVIARASTGNRH